MVDSGWLVREKGGNWFGRQLFGLEVGGVNCVDFGASGIINGNDQVI